MVFFASVSYTHLPVGIDGRHRCAAHAHVHRAWRFSSQSDGRASRGVVRRHEHAHVRKPAHERNVLEHLMAAAVGADGDAGVRGGDLHVEVAVAHGVADLVVGATRSEHGERAGVGDMAGGREAGGHIHHVLLGDAAVEQTVGEAQMCIRDRIFPGRTSPGVRR